MAVKSLYFKNAAPSGASTSLSLQDGGTAPTAAITSTGWTVAKLAATNLSAMLAGTKRASTTFSSADAIPSFAASACFRSENMINGVFANTSWSLAFRLRAVSAASSQTGAIKVRIWRSTNADGTSATQLTSAVLTGTTTAALSTSASGASTVTWSPGATVTLSNEYLWVQVEWNIVATAGSNNADAVVYVESAGVITTPDFTPISTPYSITAQVGTFVLTPRTVRMVYDRDIVATAGDFDLLGQTINTPVARRLGAAVYAINLNEKTAGLRGAHTLAVSAGSVALTGQAANLIVAQASVHHTLVAQVGAIALAGGDADLLVDVGEVIHDYVLDADPAMLALAGQLASLTIGAGFSTTRQPGKIIMGIPNVRLHSW